jgi:hypothetical protein
MNTLNKHFDIVYTTKSGRGMVAKNVVAKNQTEAKQKLKKEMQKSTSFDKIITVIEISNGLKKPATKGLTTLCAKTVGVPGRRKKDGTQKKGYVASKGGTLKKRTPVQKK